MNIFYRNLAGYDIFRDIPFTVADKVHKHENNKRSDCRKNIIEKL